MKKTILIVDDEPELREVLRSEFESEGYEVHEAASGNKAYELLQRQQCDLVLSDLRMPDGNGIDLLRKIKSKGEESPVVIFISAYSEMKPEEIYHLGAEGLITKPWKPDKLIDMVSSLLSSKEKRWQRKSDRYEFQTLIEIESDNFKSGLEGKLLNIGRGGMFIQMNEHFPSVGARVGFSFMNPKKAELVEGVAIVRWVRANGSESVPSGIGLEFAELSESQLMPLLSLLLQLRPKPFIPQKL